MGAEIHLFGQNLPKKGINCMKISGKGSGKSEIVDFLNCPSPFSIPF